MWNFGDWVDAVTLESCDWPTYPLEAVHVRSVLRAFAELTPEQREMALELVREGAE